MTILTYVIGAVIIGLYGALKWALSRLKVSQNHASELEMKLSQADYEADVAEAKRKLEELEKE